MKSLETELTVVADRIEEISRIFTGLYMTSKQNNDESNIIEGYAVLTASLAKYASTFKVVKSNINKDLIANFAFLRKEKTVFKELIAKMEANKGAYQKSNSKLIARKEDLFLTKNVAKWELRKNPSPQELKVLLGNKEEAFKLMLPKDSMETESVRHLYGYYLNKTKSEFDRLNEILWKTVSVVAVDFSQNQINNVTTVST